MIKVIIFVCLLVLPSFAASEDYRLRYDAISCTPRNCTVPGTLCESCSALIGCVEQPDGSLVKTPVTTCASPSYCVDGACTSVYDPVCSGTADLFFPCLKVGIFPHPFYRTKFVLCIEEGTSIQSYVNSCQPGFGFNIANDLCDIPLEDGECPGKDYPVPACVTAGQSGALPEKPAMFYICKGLYAGEDVLYPYLDICPEGEEYKNYNCGGPLIIDSK